MESVVFFIFTFVIGYIIYWSIKNDDIQDRIDEQKKNKKTDIGHPSRKS